RLNNEYPEARYKEFIQKNILEPRHQNNVLIAKWYGQELCYHSPVSGNIKDLYKEQDLVKLSYSIKGNSKEATFTGEDILSAQSMLHSRRILKETHRRIDKLEQSVDKLKGTMHAGFERLEKLIMNIKGINRIGTAETSQTNLLDEDEYKDKYGGDEGIL
ncbi:MAG: hypothetical protein NZ455_16975, partial [Bacteroidia bacterium]|nr:hypothetical protein [Bacteroidia bacterium]